MKFEPGRLNTGFHVFSASNLGTEDFREFRSLATGEEYFIDMNDHRHGLGDAYNPSRDVAVFRANNVVGQAIARWMQCPNPY